MKKAAFIILLLLVLPVYASENPKAFVVKINIKNNSFTVLERKVVYGYAPEHFVQWKDFRVKLLSQSGVVDQYGVMDPRIQFYEGSDGNPEGFEARFVDEANLTLVFPFNATLSGVSVHNYTSGEELVKADLKDVIESFCSQNRNDSDCAGVVKEPADTPPVSPDFTPLIGLIVIVVLLALGIWQLKRK
ncbi:MAG: hypothetical protein QXF56_04825 [Candidatus Micrarchaeia archaeon]